MEQLTTAVDRTDAETDAETDVTTDVDDVVDELLIEEISIDGMCGVY